MWSSDQKVFNETKKGTLEYMRVQSTMEIIRIMNTDALNNMADEFLKKLQKIQEEHTLIHMTD